MKIYLSILFLVSSMLIGNLGNSQTPLHHVVPEPKIEIEIVKCIVIQEDGTEVVYEENIITCLLRKGAQLSNEECIVIQEDGTEVVIDIITCALLRSGVNINSKNKDY